MNIHRFWNTGKGDTWFEDQIVRIVAKLFNLPLLARPAINIFYSVCRGGKIIFPICF